MSGCQDVTTGDKRSSAHGAIETDEVTVLSSCVVFFVSSRRRHTRCSRDWSSDVWSSDLPEETSALARFSATSIFVSRGLEGRVGTWRLNNAFKLGPNGNSGEGADATKGSGAR